MTLFLYLKRLQWTNRSLICQAEGKAVNVVNRCRYGWWEDGKEGVGSQSGLLFAT